MNAIELARNKFNALFAVHDSQDLRTMADQQKNSLEIAKKAATKKIKQQTQNSTT